MTSSRSSVPRHVEVTQQMSRKAAAERAKLEAILKAATDDARRLFVAHEKERLSLEQADKAASDNELFERVRELERLRTEHEQYSEVARDLREIKSVRLEEARRHAAWEQVREYSWLPDVNSEAEINAFLSTWQEAQKNTMGMMNTDRTVHFRYNVGNTTSALTRNIQMEAMVLQRIDAAPSTGFRRDRVNEDLTYCVHAIHLTEEIAKAADVAMLRGNAAEAARHVEHIKLVNSVIQAALDSVTCVIGQNLEVFGIPEEETVTRIAPSSKEAAIPYIKYGLWIRNADKRANINQVKYPELGIQIDPKDPQSQRLPRSLGLQAISNIAIRAMQLTFNPCSFMPSKTICQNYIALDAVLVLESVTFPERPKKIANTEWMCRAESALSFNLHRNKYPPSSNAGGGSLVSDTATLEDITMKISFELPKTVVMRQHSLLIGKWNAEQNRWEHSSTATLLQESLRLFAFLSADLTILAVIQEKGFDVPYERWHIHPVANDEVIFSIEGRRRGEISDREITIVIRDDLCQLVGPDDPELASLRAQWLPPPTLLRLLARAGFNFILDDVDGQNLPHMLTKTKELEAKVNADIALFASNFAFSSSRHNKAGEDRNMALFRLSKEYLTAAVEKGFDPDPDDESRWWSVRYETERCTLAQFTEADEDAQLSSLPNRVTHINLFKMLAVEYGEEKIAQMARDSNPLLQQCIIAILSLVRPFTWG